MLRWLIWELAHVFAAWLHGEGNLAGLLVAWWEIASGQVLVEDVT